MWSISSASVEQRTQLGDCNPWRYRRAAVEHFLCSASQKKCLTFVGTDAFQSSFAPSGLEPSMNSAC